MNVVRLTGPFLAVALAMRLTAAGGDDPPEHRSTASDEARAERLRLMTRCARDVEFFELTAGGPNAAALLEPAVQRFDDVSRGHQDGTVWVWGKQGRPTAVLEIYTHLRDGPGIVHVGHSLSTRRVLGRVGQDRRLQADRAGVEFRDLPRQPRVGRKAKARLLQFRALARKFDAHEFWDPDNTRYELRLLTKPIHRYQDQANGVLDGAMFVLANGTNPEVVLLLEVQRTADELRWRYALARMGHARIHVSFAGDEVWQQRRFDQIPPGTPYWVFVRQSDELTPAGTSPPNPPESR